MKLNRKWIMVLALVMSMAMATTGTLAYLTDRDSEANVFTMGNVDIDLKEDFEQGAELIPGLDIEKKPTITNTGKTDAWVWATIAIPSALDNDDASKNVVHFNYSEASVAEGLWNWKNSEGVWNVAKNVKNEEDGVEYNVYTVLYDTILKPGETTEEPVIYKVYMDPHVDIDPEGNIYHVEAGVATDLGMNIKDDGTPTIYVSAYAVQAEGFADCEAAWKAYTAQWTATGDAVDALEWGAPTPVVSTADELIEALENGEDVILANDIKINPASMSNAYGTTGINIKNGQTINGCGYTIDIQGAGGTWDSGINTTGGLIKDLTVTGSFRGIFINHNSTHSETVVLDNVTIDGTTYTISCDQGMNQNLVATDSTFNGWTSFAATLGTATFTNCNFGEGNGYAYCRPYAPTAFINCTFEEGYKIDARGACTFENCYLGDTLITAENIGTLVTGNTANATVK